MVERKKEKFLDLLQDTVKYITKCLKLRVFRYVFGGEVSSLRTSDDEIVSEGQYLSISDAIGRKLRDGDKIRYKVTQ